MEQCIFANPKIEPALNAMQTITESKIHPITYLKETVDHKHLVAVSMNIQSLPQHFHDISNLVDVQKADVITLTETWLQKQPHQSAFPLKGIFSPQIFI